MDCSKISFLQGACEGDSGGPLTIDHWIDENTSTKMLIGLHSGGVNCGSSAPQWFMRVSVDY